MRYKYLTVMLVPSFFRYLIPMALIASSWSAHAQDPEDRLKELADKYPVRYEILRTDTFFTYKYKLFVNQPVDHERPQEGSFEQAVYLSHLDFGRPVILITEGYSGHYAAHPRYINELAVILNANQICVEHRFFGESVPDPPRWEHLNIRQAAADHHTIIEILRNLYPGPWVSTGISKGGQTMMYHRYFYPDDVTASVGYVCPLNFSVEDPRVYLFLEEVGDPECRQTILNYQTEMFRNKSRYLPAFEKLAEERNLNYRMGITKGYELTVLEYSFSFWQWGQVSCDSIPGAGASPEIMVGHLDEVAGLEWISDQGIDSFFPFFYQAMGEIGFYGYDIGPFMEWVSFTENPVFRFTVPDSLQVRYDPLPMERIDHFIRHHAGNMIFIYGEYDPWSATAAGLTHKTNSRLFLKPGGSHLTRIRNLPQDMREEVTELLMEWLGL